MCMRVHAAFKGSVEYPIKNKYEGEIVDCVINNKVYV